MKVPFHGESVKLLSVAGEELVCGKCHHRNACLQTMSLGDHTIYECRDCHVMFVTSREDKPIDTGRKDFRDQPLLEIRARVIARSLGKSCYECHSFDIRELPSEERAAWQDFFIVSGRGDKWEAARLCPTHRCGNCGKDHRY